MEESFIRCSSPRGELQSSGDQYHRDGGGLQVRTWQLCKCLPETTWRAEFCVCLCACFRDVHQRGLSRPVFLSESDQWDAVLCALVIDLDFDGQKEVLLGTYGQVPAPFYWCTLKLANSIKAVIALDEEDGDSLLYILVCRNFFVTNSNQWGMTTMGSLSYSGGGASRVRCCLLYTWIWLETVWGSSLFLHWRDCISYRFVEQSFGTVISGADVCHHSSPLSS